MDWIAIAISPAEVGKLTYFETLRLGARADTMLELYGPDGTTLLAQDDDDGYGLGSLIAWTPAAPGTYFIKVKPYSSYSNAANCGATYSFFVSGAHVYLPWVAP